MFMPLISVIVPVYKVEAYLKECIDSILNQSFKDFELILVDDGSPDSCPSICDEYAKKDSRVIVIHKENGGLSSARNAGIDYVFTHSKSEYISFVDGDDYVDKRFLEKLYEAIYECEASMCYYIHFDHSGIINEYEKMLEVTVSGSEYFTIEHYRIGLSVCVNKLYKRSVFNELRFPVGKIHEDDYIVHPLIAPLKKIHIIPFCLYFYRNRTGSIMAKRDTNSMQYIITELDININTSLFYMRNPHLGSYSYEFRQALNSLIAFYPTHRKELKPFYKELKPIYNHNKKIYTEKGVFLFFVFPRLYCRILKTRQKRYAIKNRVIHS